MRKHGKHEEHKTNTVVDGHGCGIEEENEHGAGRSGDPAFTLKLSASVHFLQFILVILLCVRLVVVVLVRVLLQGGLETTIFHLLKISLAESLNVNEVGYDAV